MRRSPSVSNAWRHDGSPAGAGLGLELVHQIDDVERAIVRHWFKNNGERGRGRRGGCRRGRWRWRRATCPCHSPLCSNQWRNNGSSPIRTTLRCCSMKPPPARSRTSVSFTSAVSKSKSSMSLASGSLATVIWYLIDRAFGGGLEPVAARRLSLVDLGLEKLPDHPLRLVLALHGGGEDLVVGTAHAVARNAHLRCDELELPHGVEGEPSARHWSERQWRTERSITSPS